MKSNLFHKHLAKTRKFRLLRDDCSVMSALAILTIYVTFERALEFTNIPSYEFSDEMGDVKPKFR